MAYQRNDNTYQFLRKLMAFWSSVMLASRRYKGDPMSAHKKVEGIEPELFEVWLGLFEETVRDLYTEDLVNQFMVKARRIGESLKMGLFYDPAKMAR